MDYNKVDNIDIDGNGNITLQDVNGENITVNYNDTEKLKKLIDKIGGEQTFELKKIIASQEQFNKHLFDIASNLQKLTDKKQLNVEAKAALYSVDKILFDFTQKEIQGIKKQLENLYKLLREYEDELLLADDPKQKKRYKKEIDSMQSQIKDEKQKLKKIINI